VTVKPEARRTIGSENMWELHGWLNRLELRPGCLLSLRVPNPDLGLDLQPGETLPDGRIHRSHRFWLDLAEIHDYRVLTPRRLDGDWVELIWIKMKPFRRDADRRSIRYHVEGDFARIDKTQEPYFCMDYGRALGDVALETEARVLSLGAHTGNEIGFFKQRFDQDFWRGLEFVAIDRSGSALGLAKARFPDLRVKCMHADFTELGRHDLGRFDLIIALGVLQIPEVRGRQLIIDLVKCYTKDRSSLILGFPNARYRDGELCYGARMVNYREPESSLLIKDLFYYRRLLQQHGFRVKITGKYEIFMTATR